RRSRQAPSLAANAGPLRASCPPLRTSPLMTRRRTGCRWGRQGASAAQPRKARRSHPPTPPRQARATVPEGGVPGPRPPRRHNTANRQAPAHQPRESRDSESAHDQAADDGDEEVGPESQPDERVLPGGDGGGLETAEIAPHAAMLVELDEKRPPPTGNPANVRHPQIVGHQHLVTGLPHPPAQIEILG